MKISGLVLMLSAGAICDAGAGEAIQRNQLFAQMDQPKQADSSRGNSSRGNSSGGSCMPIGLTARGELVFPWDCREIIERERGPISLDLSAAPKESAPNPPALGEPTVKPSSVQPSVTPSSVSPSAIDATSKDHAAPQSSDAEHVGSIPDAPLSPAPAATTARPSDRRAQGARSAAGRQPDSKGSPTPVPPATTRPKIEARFPSPG
jgi:hypothetical protein